MPCATSSGSTFPSVERRRVVDGRRTPRLITKVSSGVPINGSVILKLRRVLSVSLCVVPLVLKKTVKLRKKGLSFFLRVDFFTYNVTALLRDNVFVGCPVTRNPSCIPLNTLYVVKTAVNVPAVVNDLVPNTLVIVLLNIAGLFSGFVHGTVPPFVNNVVVLVINLALIPATIAKIFDAANGLAIGTVDNSIAFIILLLYVILRCYLGGDKLLRVYSMVVTLIINALITIAVNKTSFDSISGTT